MFEKVHDCQYLCRCGSYKYVLKDGQREMICSGNVGLYFIYERIGINGNYEYDIQIHIYDQNKTFTLYSGSFFVCKDILKQYVESFNKQIQEQMYAPGGVKYLEAENKIQKLSKEN